MKLAVSNIAWAAEDDAAVCAAMRELGFSGLEIAPTRIFPEQPYADLTAAAAWAQQLRETEGFVIPSMQSIWYGRTERLFGSPAERETLFSYTQMAMDFAAAVGCGSLVFGCPKNRALLPGEDAKAALSFFRGLGAYAAQKHTVLAMEANPPMYHTNFVNTTAEALSLVREVNTPGFMLNLDVGTMLANGETVSSLAGCVPYISHVHISEPGLKPVERRALHKELFALLKAEGYDRYVSIEMGRQEDLTPLLAAMRYVSELAAA